MDFYPETETEGVSLLTAEEFFSSESFLPTIMFSQGTTIEIEENDLENCLKMLEGANNFVTMAIGAATALLLIM